MNESISARVTRLNNLIIGHTNGTSKVGKLLDCLSREGLLDAFCLLYNECNKENLKKKDKNIADFIIKYRDVISETKKLRVNANDFNIKSLIGKGYFGDVYLASEKVTNDIYAVKKIRKSVTITSSQIKEERDIMAANNCEWITSLQYAFQDNDHLYLVMEYVPGGDLLSLMIRNGAFDEDLSKFFLAEMTLALNALHAMGYVHRDIKPENILLDRFGHLKLADFGNATHLNKDGNVVSMSPVGTPDYIAPELLQTLSTVSSATASVHGVACDFWSMGIIGYEFITEITPFHDDNVHETYSKIMVHSDEPTKLDYPTGCIVSKEFRHLIDNLVTKPSKRLTYEQIIKHPYFKDIDWMNLRQQVPPIIPTLSGEDDTSNFEDVDKKSRRSTFTKIQAKGFTNRNDFSGQNLPFLGYSFVHDNNLSGFASSSSSSSIDRTTDSNDDQKRIEIMQRTIDEQVSDIKALQHQLLDAQRRNIQTESLEKILLEAKAELDSMKDRLKEKTIELAACRTDIKTLRSSLKIEEEMRLKSDANISEVLNQTYQKWEKAKKLSEQNYEKQIAEKKTEICGLSQNLMGRENELAAKVDECRHLQERVENYKEMLRTAKEQLGNDKHEFDANRKQIIDGFDGKIAELKCKLKQEKELRAKQTEEIRKYRQTAETQAQSMENLSEEKITIQRNLDDMKTRLNRQIEENKELRQNAANFERKFNELKLKHDELLRQHEECSSLITSRRSSICTSEAFRSAIGSLENIPSAVENQLRNDLQAAKDNETMQRDRANRLEKVVTRLEEAMDKFQSKPDDLLERQNEKLEDKLTAIREQAIIDRQASRAASLSLWKCEKQLDELTAEKKSFVRRLEQADEKFRKLREEKEQLERAILDNHNVIQLKEDKIKSLQDEIRQLKNDLSKEHAMWECAEMERMREKSEIVEHVSQIHRLESLVDEQKRKLYAIEKRNDGLVLENKRLHHEKSTELSELHLVRESCVELTTQLDATNRNYVMLKEACTIMEEQLTELEAMYEKEQRKNRESCEKNDALWTNVREKDEQIQQLRQDLNELRSMKIDIETKSTQLQIDMQQTVENSNFEHKQMIEQQEKLIEKTAALYDAQEKIEILSLDIGNLQRINSNYERELTILKEENAKILTDLFISKEEANNLSMDRRECYKEISDLKREIEQINGTMAEQKNYFVQRDIKSEATVHQYKKLISYLQQRVEELSQKKKKTFGLFGSNATPKKENIPPAMQANVETLKKMEEDLRRERARCNQLTEQLLKAKTEMRSNNINSDEQQLVEKAVIDVPALLLQDENVAKPSTRNPQHKRRSYQTHRFEMTLDNKDPHANFTTCIVCKKQVMINHSYWKCKECNSAVHRRCRSDVKTSCGGDDINDIVTQPCEPSAPPAESPIPSSSNVVNVYPNTEPSMYQGDIVLNTGDYTSSPLKINCIFEIDENTFLMGCDSGLYSYHQQQKSLVQIDGIDNVKFIATAINGQESKKCIIIADGGENLYQCDLRHLHNRAQAGECLKPKLTVQLLELPFSNRLSSERWHYAAMHYENSASATDAILIACTTCRIVILRYDIKTDRFKPICALDTAMPVNSILFTRCSAIVCSDKFFEIDLQSLSAEEFLNESDLSIMCTNSYRPRAAYQITQQEFLLCFDECGIFVDEYGSRSRPNDINWINLPNGFKYRDPLLFVSYSDRIQIMRINKSYRNEQEMQRKIDCNADDDDDDNSDDNDIRAFINCNQPIMMGNCEKLGVFVTINDSTKVLIVDGVKALKSHLSYSLETLFSSMASIPKTFRLSSDGSDTMSVDNNSSSS